MKYEENLWYGWNGGECPVHPETVVECRVLDVESEHNGATDAAKEWDWNLGSQCRVIGFRVIKEHKEPREFWIVGGQAYENIIGAAQNQRPGEQIFHVKEQQE